MALRKIILHNFWLKFFSVAMATVIWLAIHYGIHNDLDVGPLNFNRTLPQEYIKVPVTVRVRPGDPRVFRVTPDQVVVEAVGDTAALESTAKKDVHAFVDLTDLEVKEPTIVQLQPDAPRDITVVEISPPSVTVQQVSP